MEQPRSQTTELLQRVTLKSRFAELSKRAQECPSGAELLDECLAVASMLLEKNKRYGDAALNPVRIFSKAPADEQIRVRMDDKINRLMKGDGQKTEDTVGDLLGYIVLLRIAERRAKTAEEKPDPHWTDLDLAPLVGEVVSLLPLTAVEPAPDFPIREAPEKPDACQECRAPVEAGIVVCDACYQRRFGEPKRHGTLAVASR